MWYVIWFVCMCCSDDDEFTNSRAHYSMIEVCIIIFKTKKLRQHNNGSTFRFFVNITHTHNQTHTVFHHITDLIQ